MKERNDLDLKSHSDILLSPSSARKKGPAIDEQDIQYEQKNLGGMGYKRGAKATLAWAGFEFIF